MFCFKRKENLCIFTHYLVLQFYFLSLTFFAFFLHSLSFFLQFLHFSFFLQLFFIFYFLIFQHYFIFKFSDFEIFRFGTFSFLHFCMFYVLQFFTFLLFCFFLHFLMKFPLCLVSFNNTPILFCFRAGTLCYWNDGSVLSRFLLRTHCRVGTFIWIDLSPCCCAAHSICSIQSFLVSMRPCTLVAWLKPLHPSHLEVWFFQPCHHTHISSCLDTEIRALPTTQSHDSTNTESD